MQTLKYIVFTLLIFVSCSGEKAKEKFIGGSTLLMDEHSIVLTPQQVSAIKLKFDYIRERNLTNVIKANGYLDVPPQNKAVISPMVTGYVRKINFLVGDYVRKGQITAELESMEFIDMQQRYIELSAEIDFLKEEYDRQKLLRDRDAISKKQLLSAEVNYKTKISALDGLRSKLGLLQVDFERLDQGLIESGILLRSPISGSVKMLNTTIGKHVGPSEEIFEIVNPDHLHLELSVYEKDVLKVKKGQKVWFKIPSLQNSVFEGEVFLVGKDLSEDKRAINIHVHINEEEAPFTIGMYANATVVVEENPSYTLPVSAVVMDGGKEYVFKKSNISEDKISFSRHHVITGIESDGLIELTDIEGLSLTDDIVVDGAFYLINAFKQSE